MINKIRHNPRDKYMGALPFFLITILVIVYQSNGN